MPLDQAVLEHQVVGGVPAEEGATPQVDVVVVAARRDMVASFVEPLRDAGLEPVGVDLSAFGMIRALAGVDGPDDLRRRRRGRRVRRIRPSRPGGSLLQRRRRHQPRRRARPRLPLHPRLARSAGGDRRPTSPAERGLSPEHADAVALPRRARDGRWRRSRAIGETVAAARRVLEEGVTRSGRRAAPLARLLRAPRRARCRSSGSSSAAPAAPSPASPPGWKPGSAFRSVPRWPPALAGLDEAAAARLTLPYGLALES